MTTRPWPVGTMHMALVYFVGAMSSLGHGVGGSRLSVFPEVTNTKYPGS